MNSADMAALKPVMASQRHMAVSHHVKKGVIAVLAFCSAGTSVFQLETVAVCTRASTTSEEKTFTLIHPAGSDATVAAMELLDATMPHAEPMRSAKWRMAFKVVIPWARDNAAWPQAPTT